jgi:hypothetical protein
MAYTRGESEMMEHIKTGHEQDSSHQTGRNEASKRALQVDPSAVGRLERARHAFQAAQAIQTRQRRWEMQSALLPFLKQEAMQSASVTSSKAFWNAKDRLL